MKKLTTLLSITTLLFVGCNNGSDDEKTKSLLSDTNKVETISISKEVIEQMLKTLPQPIEIANIITNSKLVFSKEALLPSDAYYNYPNNYIQAMGFGAYGVDLGYINLNEKTLYTLEYLESLSKLSQKLSVDQFFDFTTLSNITKNRNNSDSLIRISSQNFNKIDDYLKEQNRGELSVLILIGSWVEGMHIFNVLSKKENTGVILQKIAEQKIVFDNIYTITTKLKDVGYFSNLKTDLEKLKSYYDAIKISYEYLPPETKEVNGELIIIDKTKTNAVYTPALIDSINFEVESIRKKYLVNKK